MISQNYFIEQDEYEGIEQECRRSAIAHFYLTGNGIEIGALHKPLHIPMERCSIRYVDYKTTSENQLRYPELIDEGIVNTDIIDNGFILNKVEDNTCDFIIANHALEHSPDPYGTLLTWLHKLTSKGIIYVTIPIVQNDLMLGLKAAVEEGKNYDDLITAHITKINRIYDIHYHTFTPSSYELFLQYFCRQTGSMLENVVKNGSGECIGIIRKR